MCGGSFPVSKEDLNIIRSAKDPDRNFMVSVFNDPRDVQSQIDAIAASGLDTYRISIVQQSSRSRGFGRQGGPALFKISSEPLSGEVWDRVVAPALISIEGVGQFKASGSFAMWLACVLEYGFSSSASTPVGTAFLEMGLPLENVVAYEQYLKEGRLLVVVQGSAAEVAKALAVLKIPDPSKMNVVLKEKSVV